jgi:flotillin
MSVLSAQTDLAHRQAELRQRQLVAEVIKPAEAEAEKVMVLAKADADRTRLQAAAAASNNRVALDRMLIEQLPMIVKEAAGGLAGANISVLNGADGLSEIAAGLVAQGLTILESVKKNLSGPAKDAVTGYDAAADGRAALPEAGAPEAATAR